MIPIKLLPDGPDMDQVEALCSADPSIKGIWVVPKYSNPTGATYSDQVVDRLSSMKTAAKDFRIFCDNAYAYHDLYDEGTLLKNPLLACKAAGNPNRVYIFGSTSKISFAGSGIAAMAASSANIADIKNHMSVQTIGPDKINMLRHVRYFHDLAGIKAHMKKHAAILRPKFEVLYEVFDKELAGTGIASWTKPRGGYFVNLLTPPHCAKATVDLADKAGLKLTKAGAAFPYGQDPADNNIRIAPSLPPLHEIRKAMEIVSVCLQLAAVGRLLT
jgi:DNA-binding transcriptional MocR family regulator